MASLIYALPVAVWALMVWGGVKVWRWSQPDSLIHAGRIVAFIAYIVFMSCLTIVSGLAAYYIHQEVAP